MKKRKIIVTGGMGYIGSHTVVELIKSHYDVIIVDNLVNSSVSTLDAIEELSGTRPVFENVDLSKETPAKEFYETHKDADAVINFAALKAVGESVQKPLSYYRNNINVLLNTLQGMLDNGIDHIIFSSSATVYALPNKLPITEEEPTKRPTNPYGNTKKIAEEIIEDVTKVSPALKAISLRYFNPIGAHPSTKLGELPSGIPNNLMPFITQTAAGVREELKVFGNDYDTPDGTAIRDYIHVVDLAKAHVLTLNRIFSNKMQSNFEVYNLGTGIGYSVLDVINSFEKTAHVKLAYSFAPRREGDVPALYTNNKKASELLGWKAERSLDDMTLSSWNWEKQLRGK